MGKQFWISVVVTFVLMMGFGFLVHGFLLAGDYGQLSGLFRTEAEQQRHFPFMLLGHAIAANAALALQVAKMALNSAARGGDPIGVERLGQALLFDSPEKRERMTAFLEKRAKGKK